MNVKALKECKNLVVLIDFGNLIYTGDYEHFTKFIGSTPTENFTCPQMLNHQPWTIEPDIFNFGLIVHFLVFKEYFITSRNPPNKVGKPLPRNLR